MEESLFNRLLRADKENHEKLERVRADLKAMMNRVDEECSRIVSAREIDALHEIDRLKKEKEARELEDMADCEKSTQAAVSMLDTFEREQSDRWVEEIFARVTSTTDD